MLRRIWLVLALAAGLTHEIFLLQEGDWSVLGKL